MSKIMLSTLAANAAAAAVTDLLDGGYAHIFEGPRPASGDAAIPRTAKLLAKLQFARPAFMPPVDGAATANAVVPDRDAQGEGRPAWFRLYRADGTTPVYDGDITTDANGAMTVRASIIGQHAEVTLDICVLRMPKVAAGR
jgi:hypothetical protein